MSDAKTDYNPDNYNPQSFANLMQFITADLMIRHEVEGAEVFLDFQPNIVKIRKKIERVYQKHRSKKYREVSAANLAEGVLLWLREGATIGEVLKARPTVLLKKARPLAYPDQSSE